MQEFEDSPEDSEDEPTEPVQPRKGIDPRDPDVFAGRFQTEAEALVKLNQRPPFSASIIDSPGSKMGMSWGR